MAKVLLTTGDNFSHVMILREDGQAVPVASTSTVQAALVDPEGTVLIQATGVSEGTAGSDWPNGKVVVEFNKTQTEAIANAPTDGRVQVRVTTAAGKPSSYFSNWFEIEKSAIPAA